jgi:hypothetical protein
MTNHRILQTVLLAGGLTLVGALVAQTRKSESVTVTLPAGPHDIEVNDSAKCTKVKNESGIPGETVTWHIKSGTNITNFHIIFPVSPFKPVPPSTVGQTYFDKSSLPATLDVLASGETATDFQYDIAVDGGSTCDPHVIVIAGRDKDKH